MTHPTTQLGKFLSFLLFLNPSLNGNSSARIKKYNAEQLHSSCDCDKIYMFKQRKDQQLPSMDNLPILGHFLLEILHILTKAAGLVFIFKPKTNHSFNCPLITLKLLLYKCYSPLAQIKNIQLHFLYELNFDVPHNKQRLRQLYVYPAICSLHLIHLRYKGSHRRLPYFKLKFKYFQLQFLGTGHQRSCTENAKNHN